MVNKRLINEMLKECCVFDIECSSKDPLTGEVINIKTDFDNYVENAKTKWIGLYSYKYQKYFAYNAITQREDIISMLGQHKTFIGFNNENFDTPVIKNNNLHIISKSIWNLESNGNIKRKKSKRNKISIK